MLLYIFRIIYQEKSVHKREVHMRMTCKYLFICRHRKMAKLLILFCKNFNQKYHFNILINIETIYYIYI